MILTAGGLLYTERPAWADQTERHGDFMDLQQVLARVHVLTNDSREALLTTLCMDAIRALESRLIDPKADHTAYKEALCRAAAAEVLYQLALVDAAQAPDSLTAGSLRAEYKTSCAQAEAYRRQCFRALSPILREDGFFFGGVRTCR